jgi:hypothetical protein
LSQRFPIEFYTTNYLDKKEMRQIEGHMRVCLKIDASLKSMKSVTASEPLLSEAAFAVMQLPSFRPVKTLEEIFGGFSVNKGDRGEFLALLLVILARDNVVLKRSDQSDKDMSKLDDLALMGDRWSRVVPVVDFVQHLIEYRNVNKKVTRGENDHEALWNEFEDDFKDSVFHMNHFIKVHDHASLSRDNLARFLVRGAGLLCGNNQKGVDAVMPALRNKDSKFSDWSYDYLLYQVKNDLKYTATPQWKLYNSMDPFELGIINDNNPPSNFIRIVFALAARNPALHLQKTRTERGGCNCVYYDIWCAGIDPDLLLPVKEEEVDHWVALLQLSRSWEDTYKGDGGWVDRRAGQNPLAGIKESFHRWFNEYDGGDDDVDMKDD